MENIFAGHSGTKLEIKNKKKTGRKTYICGD